METRELRHDRHTATLSTDHTVFSPKYRGNLVGEVALAFEGIIRNAFNGLKLEIVDMAVNVDHVHRFVKYTQKYFMSHIAKKIKGKGSRELRKAFPHITEWCSKNLWAPSCFHGAVGHGSEVVKKCTQNHEAPNAKPLCAGPILKCGGQQLHDMEKYHPSEERYL